MNENDPILQFFPSPTANVLYTALSLPPSASQEEIRKSYRRLALKYHPDKHAGKGDAEKEDLVKEFQRVGFAYAVLSDESRRKRYDSTGRTDENAFADAESMGWDAYFESLFQRIDRKTLDEDKAQYQGSGAEGDDLVKEYEASSGSLPHLLETIPYSRHDDEPRLISRVNELISSGKLSLTKKWTTTTSDTKARAKRAKAAAKEAKGAEEMAKELGVWDEFYGSGEKGKRRRQRGEEDKEGGGEDGLKALILKRQRDREGGLDALAEKYRKIEEEGNKAKGKAKGKKEKGQVPVEMTDAEFEALQYKMFGGKEGKSKKVKV